MRPGHCQGTGGQAYKEQPRERCDQERWNRVGNQNGTTHLVRQFVEGSAGRAGKLCQLTQGVWHAHGRKPWQPLGWPPALLMQLPKPRAGGETPTSRCEAAGCALL